jgi:16S rRNA A1518/A1519 N6-dimethyltransferase RsmA/KsgA/DIM1 with predicted DNA glycosylase/AP lyase activity
MSISSIILVCVVIMGAITIVWWTLRTGISPMPSSKKAVRAMLELMPSSLSGPACELGSGWGGLTLALAERYPNVPVVGYELSPIPWAVSKLRARLSGCENLTFSRADFFGSDLSDAQLLVCYLYPGGMTRLQEKLRRELTTEATIISNTFRLPDCAPETVIELTDVYRTRVYRYDTVFPDGHSGD